ncbi:MAG TPA: IS1182 family transposase [Oscillospiraceae bacterium]|nr:IS1182 family transposase [Oscillospiraceae bacterium]
MLSENRMKKTKQIEFVCIEDLVPKNHILRDIEKAIDFSFIYELVRDLYCADNGRPSIDPVVLFKIVLIQYTFGIRSMRQTIKDIEVNMAYRWFLGYNMTEPVPHFTTFGKNYLRRFSGTDIFEKIFEQILSEAVNAGFVDAKAVFIDATHIKANANNHKYRNETVKKEAKHYQAELEKEIEEDRKTHGKKPPKPPKDGGEPPTKNIKRSTTDPDCGMFHKGEHKKEFAYTTHVACDKNNFVLSADVSAGNVHDSVMFDSLYRDVVKKFPEVEVIALDRGYKTPWIMKQIFDSNRLPSVPYKRPMTKEGFFKKYEYVYDEYYDCVICPNNQILKYSTTNKEGYQEYKSNPKICVDCPLREQCTESKGYQKVVTRHVWESYMELAEDFRHTTKGKEIYKRRKETIERVFADSKVNHGLRYTQYRGLSRLKMQVLLTFSCMNLKKLAKWKRINGSPAPPPSSFYPLLLNFLPYTKKPYTAFA